MNPTVAKGGRSFKGAFAYYMHDKDADTRNRVAWTHTVNMLTDDPDKAWRVMAYTAKNQERLKEAADVVATGRKTAKPVMAYSLSWHPDQSPTPDHMRETALKSLEVLGLSQHEAVFVAHSDTPHAHVHVIVNRVHPIIGKIASDSYTYRKLSDFALAYAEENKLTYSPQRGENKRKREEGQMTRYKDSDIAEAWKVSDNGLGLIAALKERGFVLAQGNKRLVVVDRYGKIHNPTRHIEGVTAKDFHARLQGVDLTALPNAEVAGKERASQHEHGKVAKKASTPEREAKAKRPEGPVAQISEPVDPQETRVSPSSRTQEAPAVVERGVEYAEYEALKLNQLQDRHINERAHLCESHHQRIEREKDDLTAFYRLKERREQIAVLRGKCEKPSFWRKIFGIVRRDREELGVVEKNFADAKMRYEDRIHALQKQHARSLLALESVHKREWATAVDLSRANVVAMKHLGSVQAISPRRERSKGPSPSIS